MREDVRVIVPVLVESWQQQCCGAPFAVGDRVSWMLRFLPDEGAAGETVAVRTELGAGIVDLGGARLAVHGESPGGVVRGQVVEDHHGTVPEHHPASEGIVRRIRVISREFVPHPTEARRWVPRDAPPRYREVYRSQRQFAAGESGPVSTEEVGLLVDLEVAD